MGGTPVYCVSLFHFFVAVYCVRSTICYTRVFIITIFFPSRTMKTKGAAQNHNFERVIFLGFFCCCLKSLACQARGKRGKKRESVAVRVPMSSSSFIIKGLPTHYGRGYATIIVLVVPMYYCTPYEEGNGNTMLHFFSPQCFLLLPARGVPGTCALPSPGTRWAFFLYLHWGNPPFLVTLCTCSGCWTLLLPIAGIVARSLVGTLLLSLIRARSCKSCRTPPSPPRASSRDRQTRFVDRTHSAPIWWYCSYYNTIRYKKRVLDTPARFYLFYKRGQGCER